VADPVAAAEPVDEEKEKEEETEAAEDEEDTLLDRAQPDLTGPFAHVQVQTILIQNRVFRSDLPC
jgi:hypothetical protein